MPTVADYEVKSTVHTQARADSDSQASLYLAGRWLTGQPASEFCFAQIAKPGKRRKHMSTSLVNHPPHDRAAARQPRPDRPGRATDRRGCWPEETADVVAFPGAAPASTRGTAEAA